MDKSGVVTREEFAEGLLDILLRDVSVSSLQQMKLLGRFLEHFFVFTYWGLRGSYSGILFRGAILEVSAASVFFSLCLHFKNTEQRLTSA